MKRVQLFTDGSCLGNPGPGGWAAILRLASSGQEKELCGGFARTTNNRMEIISVLAGLQALKEPCFVDVYSDSQYVCNAIKKGWLTAWRNANWVKSDKKPVKNRDLWEALVPLLVRHQVTVTWLRGHAGHPENERCDQLARAQASLPDLPVDAGAAGNV